MAHFAEKIRGILSPDGENLRTDSRHVGPGDIFVAIKGCSVDGHDHVKASLEKGASLAICEREIPGLSAEEKDRVMQVADTRAALGEIAREAFGDPSSSLSVYGVTGTNGKSTTVFLIESVLNSAGRGCGLISTVYNKVRADELRISEMTTPDILSVNRMLKEMVGDGKVAASLEISSHALDQKRVWGVSLDAAVFTNITSEHLDYHKDMAQYLSAKAKIFDNLKADGFAVLNTDDPLIRKLSDSLNIPRIVTFGMLGPAEVSCSGVCISPRGTEFDLIIAGEEKTHISTPLIGNHNVYNMLAASAALYKNGISPGEIKNGLETARPVPGRLDPVVSDAPFTVFVDYAHTPNALENVLGCLKGMAGKKLICVFGCGGDRDKTKRPVMGKIAAGVCDKVIITSDNPRTEDADSILSDIQKGVLDKNNYSIIRDRYEAIDEALKAAEEGDIVVIAGKGHEDYQIVGKKKIHFDDREAASQILERLGYSRARGT
jgi:UDP-N-acetylmuramoyl-L-alanyl-D-glutamate--2,6-diaminopimelate ligase